MRVNSIANTGVYEYVDGSADSVVTYFVISGTRCFQKDISAPPTQVLD
jgi:hypothetical protein